MCTKERANHAPLTNMLLGTTMKLGCCRGIEGRLSSGGPPAATLTITAPCSHPGAVATLAQCVSWGERAQQCWGVWGAKPCLLTARALPHSQPPEALRRRLSEVAMLPVLWWDMCWGSAGRGSDANDGRCGMAKGTVGEALLGVKDGRWLTVQRAALEWESSPGLVVIAAGRPLLMPERSAGVAASIPHPPAGMTSVAGIATVAAPPTLIAAPALNVRNGDQCSLCSSSLERASTGRVLCRASGRPRCVSAGATPCAAA